MVVCSLLFKKRNGADINNMDFVMDDEPIGINQQTGFPIYREIDHPSIISQDYVNTYKQLNTTDNYGIFTEFLIRPGVRKMRQNKVQLTVEQKGSDFHEPAFLIGFFGFRPGTYDPASGAFTPLIDFFQQDRSANMMCDNLYDELDDTSSGSVWDTINQADFVPKEIEEFAGIISIDFYDSPLTTFNSFGGTSTTLTYDGGEDFSTISESDTVVIQNCVPGISTLSGSYLISNWTENAPISEYTIPFDSTAYPQGYVVQISIFEGFPDAFLFGTDAANVIAASPITIDNMPTVTNANGTFTAQAHPLGGGFIQLVERPDQGNEYSMDNLISLLKTEKGIPQSTPTFDFKGNATDTVRLNPLKDFALVTSFEHTTSTQVSNRIFSSHNLLTPLFNHNIDSAAFPDDVVLQAKVVVYIAKIEYTPSGTNPQDSVLHLIPSDDINSFSADVSLI